VQSQNPTPIGALPPAPPDATARKRRRRIVLFGVLGGVLLLSAAAAYYWLRAAKVERELAEAIAEADALDPGWRLEELEANRKPVPDGQNAAPIVTRLAGNAFATLNRGTNRLELWTIHDEVSKLSPAVALTERQTADLRRALLLVGPIVTEARKLAKLPHGRFPCNVKPALNWTVANVDHVGVTIWFLSDDAIFRIQDGDPEGAWTSCQAALNAARSLGDEPVQLVQRLRAIDAAQAIRLMERTLAYGEVPIERVAETQALLHEESLHPGLLITLRSSRAFVHHSCVLLQTRQASLAEAKRTAQRLAAGAAGPSNRLADEVIGILHRGEVEPAHAWLLRYLSQAVEIAKRPEHEVEPALKELEQTLADAPDLARQLAPKLTSFDFRRGVALARCAMAGLAIERYRLLRAAWPATLDELVAEKLLPAVPADPYNGKPLRYRRTLNGVVVFSVGPRGDGDGAALDNHPATSDADRAEFRLWNGTQREPRR
jgi:hypothetical protein